MVGETASSYEYAGDSRASIPAVPSLADARSPRIIGRFRVSCNANYCPYPQSNPFSSWITVLVVLRSTAKVVVLFLGESAKNSQVLNSIKD